MPLGPTIGGGGGSDSDGVDHDGDGVIFDGTPNERAAPKRGGDQGAGAAKKKSDARMKARRDYLASKDTDKGPKATQANQRETRLNRAVARERLHGWEPSADGRHLKPAAGRRGAMGPAGPRNHRGAVNFEANTSGVASPDSRASSAENTSWAPGAADAPRGRRGKSYDDPTLSVADLDALDALEMKVYDPTLTVGEMEDLEFKARRFGRIGGGIGSPHPSIGGRPRKGGKKPSLGHGIGKGGGGGGKRRLRPAAFDPHAEDADGDGMVQEGTTAAHPAVKVPKAPKTAGYLEQMAGTRDDSSATTSRDKIGPNKLVGMEMLHPKIQKTVQRSASKDAVRKAADDKQHAAIQRINAAKTRDEARKIADDFIKERQKKIAELNKKMHGDAGTRALSAKDSDELASNIWQLHWMTDERRRMNGDRAKVGEIQRRAMSEKSQRLLASEDTHRAAEKRAEQLVSKKVDQNAPKSAQIKQIKELQRREREDLATSKRIAETSNEFHNITREEAVKHLVIAKLDNEIEMRRTQERNMSARKILTGSGADEVDKALRDEPKLNINHESNGFVAMTGSEPEFFDYDNGPEGFSSSVVEEGYIFLPEQRAARGVTVKVTPKKGPTRQGIITSIDHGTEYANENGVLTFNDPPGAAWMWVTHENGKALDPREQYWDLLPGDTTDDYEFHASNRQTRELANFMEDTVGATKGRKAGKKDGAIFSRGVIQVNKDGSHSYMELDRNEYSLNDGERKGLNRVMLSEKVPRDLRKDMMEAIAGKNEGTGTRVLKEARKAAERHKTIKDVQEDLKQTRFMSNDSLKSLERMNPGQQRDWALKQWKFEIARIYALQQRLDDLNGAAYMKEKASA